MKVDEVKRILTIGAGTMGHQIGFLCALHGYEVVVFDVEKEHLVVARNRVARLADRFVKRAAWPPKKKPP
jgi:3-hydroxybutyryl-CoA dehydrogenase